jgi:hypothetical protein
VKDGNDDPLMAVAIPISNIIVSASYSAPASALVDLPTPTLTQESSLNPHAYIDHCQCQRCARNRIKINGAPAEVVGVPIPNDDSGDVFGEDDCVVLEKNGGNNTTAFLGGLLHFSPL